MCLEYFSGLVEGKLLREPLEWGLLELDQFLQGSSSAVEAGIPVWEVDSKETP